MSPTTEPTTRRHWFAWLEDLLGWLVAYVPLPLQVLLVLLVAWGDLGAALGLDDVLWDDRPAVQFGNGLAVGALFGQVAFIRCLLGRRPTAAPAPATDRPGLLRPFAALWAACLVALAAPELASARYWASERPALPLVLGLLASVLVGALFAGLGEWSGLRGRLQKGWLFRHLPGVAGGTIPPGDLPLHAHALLLAFGLVALLIAAACLRAAGGVLPPVAALCLVLALANAAFGFVAFHLRGSQYVLAAALVLWAALANYGRPYKLQFPGLDYDHLVTIDGDGQTDHYRRLLRQPGHDAPSAGLIASDEPLRAMHDRWRAARPGRPPDARPRLVLVAVSGGGIRAACWTAAVLEGLERELPAFRDRVRLFAGASGGMVGAALYAADFERHRADGEPSLTDRLAHDSLSPAVQAMLLTDLPGLWWPGVVRHDRGTALEEAWYEHTRRPGEEQSPLARPLAELAGLERGGGRPSLVFTPMLVEDARRLLVSNLDLGDLTEAFADRLSPETSTPGENVRLLSLSAVEFRRVFPAAAGFRVGTAARMSAAFPFVSPGVSLPTVPPRRVVDAGYYDNYGVHLAALWLYRHRAAVRRYTSGVALVEVRAYRTGFTRRYVQDVGDERAGPDGRANRDAEGTAPRRPEGLLTRALTFASTPMEALLSNRERGAYYRDDELLGVLDEEFNRRPGAGERAAGDPFFTSVAFECGTDAALSWKLPAYELRGIKESFYVGGMLSPQVGRQVERLGWWLGPDGGGPPVEMDSPRPPPQFRKAAAPARAAPPPAPKPPGRSGQ
jgi:hypothetical protein